MRNLLIVICSLFMALFPLNNLFGQNFEYDWEEKRDRYALSEKDSEYSFLVLKQKEIYNYFVYNDGLRLNYTYHKIIKVTNDEALQNANRIVVSLGDGELVRLKARTLNPDGSEVLFDQSELKELEDEQTGSGYKIFAIEGAVKGSEIEYYYTIEKTGDFFLTKYMQYEWPVKEIELVITSPEHLKFDLKTYNGLSKPIIKEKDEERNVYEVKATDVEELLQEAFSVYNSNRKRVEAKLAYNTARGNSRLFTWAEGAKRLYQNLFALDKSEEKAVQRLVKKMKINQELTDIQKIHKMEDYLKKTIFYEKRMSSEPLTATLRNKYANKPTMTKLYLAVLEILDIKANLVLTSDGTDLKFDPDFDSWNFITEYLIWLPELEQYLTPYFFSLRVGEIPPFAQTNKGLMVKMVEINGESYPVTEIMDIPELPSTHNQSNLYIKVGLDEEKSVLSVNMKQEWVGFEAFSIKAVYPELEEDRKKELVEDIVKSITDDMEVAEAKITKIDDEPENWLEPLHIESKYSSATLVDKAGKNYILKIGELIGPQSELYQEKERQTDVMNSFNRSYYREIELTIPEGYFVKNPDDIKMNVAVTEEDEDIYYFVSDYTIDGNKLKITIDEAYERIFYPKEKFQEFREVINAAADWNKVKLLLQKK